MDIDAKIQFGLNYLNNEYVNNLEDGGESANCLEAHLFSQEEKEKYNIIFR